MKEIFKPSPVFPDNYSVSNFGNVINSKTGYKRKLCTNKDGYLYVHLWNDGESKYCLVHRLVGLAFVEGFDPDEKPIINHKDGIKTNNLYTNLEWCHISENTQHSYNLGLQKPLKGSKHGKSKYSEKQIENVCRLLSEGNKTNKEIFLISGVSVRTIQSVKNRQNWTCISDKYNFHDRRFKRNV